jgi:hypothetical protein
VEMKMGCLIMAVLPPLLFSALSASAQTMPKGPSDSPMDELNTQARRVLDEVAQAILQGKPG